MPHELTELKINTVTKPVGDPAEELTADICVVGAGISGLSAAVEARRLGRSVVLADALPVLGGQCVNSLIGLFCGVYGNGPEYRRLTHGIFDTCSRTWAGPTTSTSTTATRSPWRTTRWCSAGGWRIWCTRWASRSSSARRCSTSRRVTAGSRPPTFATRHGQVRVRANGFVDASGDASLTWEAGLPAGCPSVPSGGRSRSGWRTCVRSSSPTPPSWSPGSRRRRPSTAAPARTAWRSSSPAGTRR